MYIKMYVAGTRKYTENMYILNVAAMKLCIYSVWEGPHCICEFYWSWKLKFPFKEKWFEYIDNIFHFAHILFKRIPVSLQIRKIETTFLNIFLNTYVKINSRLFTHRSRQKQRKATWSTRTNSFCWMTGLFF